MVRGSMLELMDHTFDGHEDSVTGDLRAGLGQLIDGRYGRDNFKAAGKNSVVKGYDWVGWKKRPPAASVNLVFTFDTVRSFSRMDIHTNNHFTKDIQVFNQVSNRSSPKMRSCSLSRFGKMTFELSDLTFFPGKFSVGTKKGMEMRMLQINWLFRRQTEKRQADEFTRKYFHDAFLPMKKRSRIHKKV